MTLKPERFKLWQAGFCQRALSENISNEVITQFRTAVSINKEIKERSQTQPEFNLTTSQYMERILTDKRIKIGIKTNRQFANLFNELQSKYQVDVNILTAIWGIETNFGKNRGHFSVIDALATLATTDKRIDFWERELVAALHIIATGRCHLQQLKGSWAGAMGHTQFMPSSYLTYAVSFRGDTHSNIWCENPADALASTANFLLQHGWNPSIPWGGEVQLPPNFDYKQTGRWNKFPPSVWKRSSVHLNNKREYTDWGQCSLLLPTGHTGPAFLITSNFDVLLRYNASTSYALAIGLLANAINNKSCNLIYWPNIPPLSSNAIITMQQQLVELGYETGGIDGIAGSSTLRSIQQHQIELGLVPDGLPSPQFLEQLQQKC